ncbi:hypothetical protein [Marinobacter orientalis]|uniref:Uncharacterized protein n=1 Tax=Marinobacter orientalis TaxID=1928859 RepID=A0A7Y0RCE7_9GAMM|nr:hypothetical protein [Marinobacter orientalis]NMT63662.1 hypothetical protein [Marinobacter orientalis]TGX49777.1 hypothetical protein DIT72_08645 [Marinobacter orientalis]
MIWLKAFVSGFLATLIFHQGLFALFYLVGIVPSAPFNLNPVPPLGVPAVFSLAFFGGLWGLVLWAILRRFNGVRFWLGNVIVGAIGPTAVAMLVVFPLKGLAVSAQTWIGGLMLNGFWGLGVALFLVLMGAKAARSGAGNP